MRCYAPQRVARKIMAVGGCLLKVGGLQRQKIDAARVEQTFVCTAQ